MEYKLINAGTTDELEEKVDKFLRKGWSISSEPIVTPVQGGTALFFYQAVVNNTVCVEQPIPNITGRDALQEIDILSDRLVAAAARIAELEQASDVSKEAAIKTGNAFAQRVSCLEGAVKRVDFLTESFKTSEMAACKRLSELGEAYEHLQGSIDTHRKTINNHASSIRELKKSSKIPVTIGLTNEAPHGKYQKLVEACKEHVDKDDGFTPYAPHQGMKKALEELGVG